MPLSRVAPEHYQSLLHAKCALTTRLLAPYDPPTAQVFASRPTAFRMRAEFRMWHDGDQLEYVMFRPEDPRTPVPVADFPIACETIQHLMPTLRSALAGNDILRRKLFQVEFLSTLAGQTLITLIYHRKLLDDWESAAYELASELGVSLVGRSRKQKVVIGQHFVTESLTVNGRDFSYRQYEQAFTQPNAEVNVHMLTWASACARELKGDLLELYCGNGNFTLPLSRHFENVIATELSKASVRAARENIADNDIDNVQVIRLSAEEVTQAMRQERPFRRLSDLPKPLHEHQLDTLFVDPPRAGLDEQTVRMASGFNAVLYMSCNADTLVQNLAELRKTHRISNFAMFDQFPYTDHMECGVLLTKN